MIYLTVWSLLALTALTSAGGLGGDPIYAPGYSSLDYYAYPRYAFEYAVKDPSTGDNKAQWERRDGDVVKGAYSLVEPDGSLRVVDYWADDKSGFNAVVKRVGPNLHPVTVPAIAPIYKAPIPVLSQGLGPIAPLAIGSISKYPGLSSAPLISGPYGGAISTASLIKATPVPVPVIPAAPIATTGLLPPGPLLPGPVWSSPVVKAVPSPVISGPLINPGLLSPGPSLAGPLYNPIGVPALKGGLNLSPLQWGNPGLSPIGYPSISPLGPWGGLGKGDLLGPGPIGDLGLYEKGPLLSGPIGNPWLGGIKGY